LCQACQDQVFEEVDSLIKNAGSRWLICLVEYSISTMKKPSIKSEPVTTSTVMVNGVPTVIKSTEHVVKNLMSGKDVVQAKNTPLCCDVSSETYWCM
jgi:hypothetical protein